MGIYYNASYIHMTCFIHATNLLPPTSQYVKQIYNNIIFNFAH